LAYIHVEITRVKIFGLCPIGSGGVVGCTICIDGGPALMSQRVKFGDFQRVFACE